MTSSQLDVWTFAITSVALFMVTLDNLVVIDGAPGHPRRPRRVDRASSSGR